MDVKSVAEAITSNKRMGQSNADPGKIVLFCHSLLLIIAVKETAVSQRAMQKVHRDVAPLARGVPTRIRMNAIH